MEKKSNSNHFLCSIEVEFLSKGQFSFGGWRTLNDLKRLLLTAKFTIFTIILVFPNFWYSRIVVNCSICLFIRWTKETSFFVSFISLKLTFQVNFVHFNRLSHQGNFYVSNFLLFDVSWFILARSSCVYNIDDLLRSLFLSSAEQCYWLACFSQKFRWFLMYFVESGFFRIFFNFLEKYFHSFLSKMRKCIFDWVNKVSDIQLHVSFTWFPFK